MEIALAWQDLQVRTTSVGFNKDLLNVRRSSDDRMGKSSSLGVCMQLRCGYICDWAVEEVPVIELKNIQSQKI